MATTGNDMHRPPASSEVVVIGGGFIGCSIAYQLAKRGVAVTLIEQEHIAWGASGRNAGQVSPAAGYTDAFLPFTVANFAMLRTMEAELDADFQFRLSGGMEIAIEPDAVTTLGRSVTALHDAGGTPRYWMEMRRGRSSPRSARASSRPVTSRRAAISCRWIWRTHSHARHSGMAPASLPIRPSPVSKLIPMASVPSARSGA